ncbi:hypothetical protein ACFLRF_03310 [Candidatus Altiarchaeota archaeon]
MMIDGTLPIILAGFILIQLAYTLIAYLAFTGRRRDPGSGSGLSEVGRRREILTSYLICISCSLMPYRVREGFILCLHVILNSVATNIQYVISKLVGTLASSLLLATYFLGLPLTILLKGIGGKERYADRRSVARDLWRRY